MSDAVEIDKSTGEPYSPEMAFARSYVRNQLPKEWSIDEDTELLWTDEPFYKALEHAIKGNYEIIQDAIYDATSELEHDAYREWESGFIDQVIAAVEKADFELDDESDFRDALMDAINDGELGDTPQVNVSVKNKGNFIIIMRDTDWSSLDGVFDMARILGVHSSAVVAMDTEDESNLRHYLMNSATPLDFMPTKEEVDAAPKKEGVSKFPKQWITTTREQEFKNSMGFCVELSDDDLYKISEGIKAGNPLDIVVTEKYATIFNHDFNNGSGDLNNYIEEGEIRINTATLNQDYITMRADNTYGYGIEKTHGWPDPQTSVREPLKVDAADMVRPTFECELVKAILSEDQDKVTMIIQDYAQEVGEFENMVLSNPIGAMNAMHYAALIEDRDDAMLMMRHLQHYGCTHDMVTDIHRHYPIDRLDLFETSINKEGYQVLNTEALVEMVEIGAQMTCDGPIMSQIGEEAYRQVVAEILTREAMRSMPASIVQKRARNLI